MRYRPAFDFVHRPALRHTGAMFLSLTLLASCRSAAPGVAQTGGVSGDMARGSSNRAAAPRATQSTAREQTADQQVQHVLNRLAFGPRPGDSEAVRRMGVDAWIAQQLQPERLDDAAATAFASRYTTLTKSADQLFAESPPGGQLQAQLARKGASATAADSQRVRQAAQLGRQYVGELTSHRVARAVLTERQLEEVMVDFWLNHFSVFVGKDRTRYFLNDYEREAIRPHALGSFRALLGAVAKSPAMLYYLDNWQSVADSGRPVLQPVPPRLAQRRAQAVRRAAQQRGANDEQMQRVAQLQQRRRGLNENYARELMELHTLGVDGGYTQQDVIEVARALTGWTLERGAQGGGFVFRPQVHDAGAKTILGQRFPAGRGVEEGEAVLDLLARHPKTAEYIATKLARRLVSDTPPPALVQRAAATFTRSNGDIREVVRTIVTSPEFFSTAAYRAKVKSPFEVVVSTLRAMHGTPTPAPVLAQLVARLGQPIYGHQAPNGWPETGDAWMNTGAILNRINFGLAVASGRVPGVRLQQWPAAAALQPLPREQQVDGVIRELLGGAVSPDTRQVLLTGTNPFLQANAAKADSLIIDDDDTNGMMTPPPAGNRPARRGMNANSNANASMNQASGLAQIIGLALGSPEFQRR
ncbi:DUF1800 domain-containing protein [Gemmatimonas sp. UBA7669]|uniref:DUF1800 domain-containing protein n=1 Tax=Gemmatimonas sp. UBA7669 TaxID=1946568 RepID=UPI0025B9DD64|nr:DUF1800 domain-containing protein [Gemmatimonas sp. UBA7669]